MKRKVIVIGTVLVALLLLGQFVSYYSERGGSSISTETDGSVISYDVDVGYDTLLSEIHIKNHGSAPKDFAVLYDEDYGSIISHSDLRATLYLMSEYLEKCGYADFRTVSVQELTEIVDSGLSSGTFSTGIVILGGALPDTVYDGTASSKIVQWIDAGGYMCWSGLPFGMHISHQGGTEEVPDYSAVCTSIFGTDGIFNNAGEDTYCFDAVNGDLTEACGLRYNQITNGIDMSKASDALFLGFTDGQYASVGVMKHGNGNLAVFGGWMVFTYAEFVVDLLAMGITYQSELVSVSDAKITNGSYSGSFEDDGDTLHAVKLHDLSVSRLWVYDRDSCRFE